MDHPRFPVLPDADTWKLLPAVSAGSGQELPSWAGMLAAELPRTLLLFFSKKANQARLKNATEFGRTEMTEGSQLHESVLRAVLYAVMELVKDIDSAEVLAHLVLNIPDYYGNVTQRELAVELADYLAKRLEQRRPEEASAARVLREAVKNQRLG